MALKQAGGRAVKPHRWRSVWVALVLGWRVAGVNAEYNANMEAS